MKVEARNAPAFPEDVGRARRDIHAIEGSAPQTPHTMHHPALTSTTPNLGRHVPETRHLATQVRFRLVGAGFTPFGDEEAPFRRIGRDGLRWEVGERHCVLPRLRFGRGGGGGGRVRLAGGRGARGGGVEGVEDGRLEGERDRGGPGAEASRCRSQRPRSVGEVQSADDWTKDGSDQRDFAVSAQRDWASAELPCKRTANTRGGGAHSLDAEPDRDAAGREKVHEIDGLCALKYESVSYGSSPAARKAFGREKENEGVRRLEGR